jgi:hypothetical protein
VPFQSRALAVGQSRVTACGNVTECIDPGDCCVDARLSVCASDAVAVGQFIDTEEPDALPSVGRANVGCRYNVPLTSVPNRGQV